MAREKQSKPPQGAYVAVRTMVAQVASVASVVLSFRLSEIYIGSESRKDDSQLTGPTSVGIFTNADANLAAKILAP